MRLWNSSTPFKYLSFGSMAAVILAMTAATFVEKLQGSPVAFKAIYHSPWFIALWAIAAISGLAYFFGKGRMGFWTTLLHCSFVVILAGALISHIWGWSGQIHLQKDVPNSSVLLDTEGNYRELPFAPVLENFEIEYYAGSSAPSDYRSLVRIPPDGKMDISMNKIGKYKGYRFYQANYDGRDMSVLAVSHDPIGVGVTYAGYLLLLASMLGFFFQKNSGWRAAIKRLSATAAMLLLVPSLANAVPKEELPVAPQDVAEALGQLYVYYGDRVVPFQSQARDYCLKAYGSASYKGYSPEQVMTGWMFYYDWWQVEPFKLKKKDIGTAKDQEKYRLRMDVATGRAFKVFPLQISPDLVEANPELQPITWFGCEDQLPELDDAQWLFIRKTFKLLRDEARQENWDQVKYILEKIRKYQEKTATEVLPSDAKVKAERAYNAICLPKVPFMATITLGIVLFILFGFWLSKGQSAPIELQHGVALLGCLLFIYLTVVLGLRWYVSGHAPFAGSYCVMMLMAWLATLAMLLLYRRIPLILPLGLLLAGFSMLMATLNGSNPKITHLMPVLNSPLLSIHVLSMMLSYTLLGLVMLNGIMGLVVKGDGAKDHLRDLSLVILYPAVFLVAFGTFLGAVWANISWGSYWAWDPKETWALITLLVYAAALHSGSLKAFRKPKFFHIYCIAAFLTVLITYFGVNLILGGMHAYA